ncbi:hypothetical protein F5Y13DRAFT_195783 [Hypoxylon sp. FL1857]|nr:hypothetical protein F5Y13DRAFT_195783 [Hypoxylon sp. FL1857]
MKSWSLIALALLASPVFGRALPVASEQDSAEAVRRSDEPETPVKKRHGGGSCGHDEQTFGNLSYCEDLCRGGGCAPHTVDAGILAGGNVIQIYECIC